MCLSAAPSSSAVVDPSFPVVASYLSVEGLLQKQCLHHLEVHHQPQPLAVFAFEVFEDAVSAEVYEEPVLGLDEDLLTKLDVDQDSELGLAFC